MSVRIGVALALTVSFVVLGISCDRSPTAPKPAPATRPAIPNSPLAVADYFQWCWRHRSLDAYKLLFTDDYRFIFATGDSAGNFYRSIPFTRNDELACADLLFRTANSITLDYTQDPDVQPDPRSGMNPTWHKLITLQVLLRVNFSNGTQEVRGPTYLYVVRGDSAQIPVDLVAAGAKPDSARWWIQQWVDGTFQGIPGRAGLAARPAETQPNSAVTWGEVKTLFR